MIWFALLFAFALGGLAVFSAGYFKPLFELDEWDRKAREDRRRSRR